MFCHILSLLQLRHSTAFLLARQDDHLLADIGMNRDDLAAMHLGLDRGRMLSDAARFHSLPQRVHPVRA